MNYGGIGMDKFAHIGIWYAMAGSAVIHLAYIVEYAINALK